MILRSGLASLIIITFLSVAGLSLSISEQAEAETWRVTNLKPSQRLHLRQRASARSRVVGYIPGNARGLKGGLCTRSWCKVEYGGKSGWVYRRYLKLDPRAAKARKRQARVKPEVGPDLRDLALKKTLYLKSAGGKPIPIFAFPNDKLPVAGLLEPGTRSVKGLGACVRNYCYVRSGQLIGWLPQSAFRSSDEPVANGQAEKSAEDVTAALPHPVHADEGEALNKTQTTATNLAVNAKNAAIAEPVIAGETKFYTLAGLSGESPLAMYREADGTSEIVAWIPNDAKKIEGLHNCIKQWCLVRWKDKRGWVARRHLADESVEGSQTFQVTGLTLWKPLQVLDGPSADANVVGAIPSYATGVVPIGGCDEQWCHVRYLGIAGWVSGHYLEPQQQR